VIRLFNEPGTRSAEPLLIGSLLRTPLATAPTQLIVYRDSVRYDYRTLRTRIGRLARVLQQLGVEEGDTVAVMDWDSHRYLECYFAIPMMGAVLMTVNLRLSPDQIAYTLQQAHAKVLLLHHDFVPLLTTLATQLPQIRQALLLEPEPGDMAPFGGQHCEYEAALAAADRGYEFREFDELAVATTFFTTGTTGLPKAVAFTHRQIVLHTLAIATAFGSAQHGQSFRHGDVYMPMTPMFHAHAWGVPYVATLLGVKQVYPGRYEPARLLALRTQERVNYSHCVPTILQMLLTAPESAATDLHGWKITIGGSALTTALAQAALARGIDVFSGYGMSETGPFLTATRLIGNDPHANASEELQRRCSTGLPAPMVELRIVDEQGRDVAHDGESMGELVARAPWLTCGYAGNAEASRELWEGGYLHTRDIATIDAAGFVQVRDRSKDVIKTGGEWVSSLQLEELIARHPDVAEVAVIAVPDERWGERPFAVVVLRAPLNSEGAVARLQQHLSAFVSSGLIQKYSVPEQYAFVAALPKTSVGKLDKKLLRTQLEVLKGS
jgi:fatty-acyl-CoA synthase